jgi:hypothetical protein
MSNENRQTQTIDTDAVNNAACRLCDGNLSYRFNQRVLRKYDVKYFECEQCRSMQTERPYWLDEAYRNHLSSLDTGAAQRNLQNLAACYVVCTLFQIRNAIDIGGGDGLLCRLLRDHAINCFVTDKFANPTYAQGFTDPDFKTPDLVFAFEVLEHFAYPKLDVEQLFHYGSRLIFVSTELYTAQNRDWWYFAPEGGQHVFFYSKYALDHIAAKYDYVLIRCGSRMLFVKQDSVNSFKSFLLQRLLSNKIIRLVQAVIMLLPIPGVWMDHSFMKNNCD